MLELTILKVEKLQIVFFYPIFVLFSFLFVFSYLSCLGVTGNFSRGFSTWLSVNEIK